MSVPDTQKRLRQWLEWKLDEGACLGLTWIDKENGIFKFPWYHYRDVSEEDKPHLFKVFVDWAKFTNKYKEGDKLDYPKFKHNLRCALNKLKDDFEKLEDNSANKEDPHVVYRFVSSTVCPQLRSPCASEYSNNLNTSEEKFQDKIIPVVVQNLAAEYVGEFSPNQYYKSEGLSNGSQDVQFQNQFLEMNRSAPNDSPEVQFQDHILEMNRSAPNVSQDVQFQNHFLEMNGSVLNGGQGFEEHFDMNMLVPNDNKAVPLDNCYDFLLSAQSQQGAHYNVNPSQTSPVFTTEHAQPTSSSYNANYQDISHQVYPPPAFPSDLAALNSGELIYLQPSTELPMSGLGSLNTPKTSFELGSLCQPICAGASHGVGLKAEHKHGMNVKVSYGQPPVIMLSENVDENGCRLYFGDRLLARTQYGKDMYGPKDVTDIMLPIVDQCSTEISDKYRTVIADILKEMDRGFSLTFDSGDIYAQRLCRSRVYFCDANFNSTCLDRKSKTPEKVFDFRNFQTKLAADATKLPPAHFYLTIGLEANPAHKNGPMSKIPVSVCVTHLTAERLYNEAQAQRRGRCDSMQPQHSGLDSCDQLLEMYKGLTINPIDKQ
ncbi:interferon regulatory factor [Elysia marginata]|uniref:Interferon regulatory factor n=1 Tax=Elysia marginata TaxID=1093978 RepID=A0AAV4FZ47_9GAST|nr:interferon regulatory factor [Elysia marginata]